MSEGVLLEKRKKVKVQFTVPVSLHERMQAIADDLGCSMNAWAIRALGYAVRSHVPFDDYINQAPTRGRGAGKTTLKRLSPFGGLLVDEMGVPEGMNVVDGELEFHRRLKEEGEPGLKRWMQMLWKTAGITEEYTDTHLAETLRVLNGDG